MMSVGCGATAADDTVMGTPLYDVAYVFSAAGQITERDEHLLDTTTNTTVRHVSTYDYDDQRRLTLETYDGVTSGFAYDALDNLTDHMGVPQTYGDASRSVRGAGPHAILDTVPGDVFSYDEVGNVAAWTAPNTSTWAVAWDQRGQVLRLDRNGARRVLRV